MNRTIVAPKKAHRLPWLLLAATGIAALVVAVVMAPTLATKADEAREIRMTKTQAATNVADFAGLDGQSLDVSDPFDGAFARFYEVVGDEVVAHVDVHDGRIATLLLLDEIPSTPEIKVTSEEALAVARAFLDDHGVAWKGLRETVELRNHGESNEYVIAWERWEGEILTPDSRTVGVNATTGRVFRYADIARPFTTPDAPALAKATASDAALAATGFGAKATVTSADLRIVFGFAGQQRLVWWVYVEGPVADEPDVVAHALVEVDASTGAAKVLGTG
jgi:hypothetical protein